MNSDSPRVCIVIVNWNGWEDTVECLHSVENLEYDNYSVIVVDNASSDASVKEIKRRFDDITLLESKKNKGFAGGNNIGIRYAMQRDADYVWLLNNDTVVDAEALSKLVMRMNYHPEIGITGSKLIYYHQRDTLQAMAGGNYSKWLGITKNIGQNKLVDSTFDQDVVEDQLEYIVGASMLVSRAFINRVGLLNEDYFLYYEEVDWAMRGGEEFTLGFAPESLVYHKEGASTGGRELQTNDKSKNADYYQLKNRLKFSFNYFPFYLPVVYLTMVYAIFNRIKRGQWNRIPMILKLMVTFNR